MATLQELIDALASLGIERIAGIMALLTVLLIVLISLAVRGRRKRKAAAESARQQHRDVSSGGVRQPSTLKDSLKDNKPVAKPVPQLATEQKTQVVTEKVEVPVSEISQVPQDSVLRRHYLANEEAKEAALHEPYPSDSVLRRHYDVAHKVEVDVSATAVAPAEPAVIAPLAASEVVCSDIPEDSVLHRHYLANEEAKEAALHEPYPSDSVLRRHYDASHKLEADVSPAGGEQAESTVSAAASEEAGSDIPEDSVLHRHYLANEEAKEAALHEPYPSDSVLRRHYDVAHKIVVDAGPAPVMVDTVGAVAPSSRACIPEDSVLRRHVIAQLITEVEAALPPRPADSVLRRHYESLLGFELEKRLAG